METRSSFVDTYQQMPDVQLLQIANEGGLLPEAREALTEEISRRKLKKSDLPRHKPSKRDRLVEQTRERRIPFTRGYDGVGLYGRTYLSEPDRAANIYVRTKFLVLASVPLIPLASYRFQTSHDGEEEHERPLNRVPLNWNQVLVTWLKVFLVLVGLLIATAVYIKLHG